MHCIGRFLEPLLRLLWPAPGQHRALPEPEGRSAAPTRVQSAPTRRRAPAGPFLRGEDSALVRPYLEAYEREVACRCPVHGAAHGAGVSA